MKITVLIDNQKSWMMTYVNDFIKLLVKENHTVKLIKNYHDLKIGDIAFFLSCNKIVPRKYLQRHKHNIVVHSSDLPEGRGWSPLTWQILEGKNFIFNTLFEAKEELDTGPIYQQEIMKFEGHELLDEIHAIQAKSVIKLCFNFIKIYPPTVILEQTGKESYYPRRRPENSEIDINKTIKDLFNQFRVADNEQYPIFFKHMGYKYILNIRKERDKYDGFAGRK